MKINKVYRKVLQSYTLDNILCLLKNIMNLFVYIYIYTNIYIYIWSFRIYYNISIFYSSLKLILHYSANLVTCLSILTSTGNTDFHNLREKNFKFMDKIYLYFDSFILMYHVCDQNAIFLENKQNWIFQFNVILYIFILNRQRFWSNAKSKWKNTWNRNLVRNTNIVVLVLEWKYRDICLWTSHKY